MITTDFAKAEAEYSRLYPGSPFFATWVPQSHFISAEIDEKGNFTSGREDNGIYGIAIGSSPVIPSDWKSFSLDSRAVGSLPESCTAIVEWDCYWAPTAAGEKIATTTSTDGEIDTFLKEHAPDSSVFPGNDEILQWIEIMRDGKLAAVAALCRWESGRIVISSVATHTALRGKGLGKELMQKTLIAGDQWGEKYLSLGVRHQNESAQRLYQGMGFTLMHNFTYCERR